MTIIDPKFLDVDFAKQPKYTKGYEGDGRNPALAGACRAYHDSDEMLPEKEWRPIYEEYKKKNGGICGMLEWLIVWIFNQGQEGSCVGNGSTQAYMIALAMAIGKNLVTILSPISLYQLIGSSPGSGAMVDDAMHKMQQGVLLPLDNEANRKRFGDIVMPATGFYTKRPKGWEAVGARFKGVEFLEVQGVASMVSALAKGYAVVVGRDGHCICYVGYTFVDGKLYFVYVNSWGEWGMAGGDFKYGFGLDSASGAGARASQWAFAVKMPTVSIDDYSGSLSV